MNQYKPRRGVSGALECVCCFERDCFGCALTAPPIGVCPVCGQDVRLGDSCEWQGDDPIHWDCLDETEKVKKMSDKLIQVVQLPVIEEQLRTLKDRWEQKALDAEAMVCTADTIQAVKTFRAEMRKEFDEVEALRKQAKRAVMDPYNRFEAVYKECVTEAFQRADRACSNRVSEVEQDMKRRCEDGLREYFAELCTVHHLDWLTYERAGIKVDMASAKAKTPKKLREQLEAFVSGVSAGVDIISSMDCAAEIMVEFKKHLDTTRAICDVADRHHRIEEQKAAQETRKAERTREAEMVKRVEALAPPVVVEAPVREKTILVSLIMHPTRSQYEDKIRPIMKELRRICDKESIKYE